MKVCAVVLLIPVLLSGFELGKRILVSQPVEIIFGFIFSMMIVAPITLVVIGLDERRGVGIFGTAIKMISAIVVSYLLLTEVIKAPQQDLGYYDLTWLVVHASMLLVAVTLVVGVKTYWLLRQ